MHMGGPAPAWEGHRFCLQGRADGSRARVSKALGEELHAVLAPSTVLVIPTPTPHPFQILVFHATHSQKPSLFLLCALSQNLLKSNILTLDVLLQFYLAWLVFEIIAIAYRKKKIKPTQAT